MAPKRQIAQRSPSFTDSDTEHARKRLRSSSAASEAGPSGHVWKIHIVQAKIDEEELQQLFRLIDDSPRFELTSDPSDADVIATNLRMRKRFERHVPWNVAVGLHTFSGF
jgi:DNA polymerase mu